MQKKLSIFTALCFSILQMNAQSGIITGKIIDTKLADVVIGATVKLDEGSQGATSDLDGNFQIQKVPVGTHKITISYLGFATKTIEGITVKEGQSSIVDVPMEEAQSTVLQDVVIVAKVQQSGQTALTLLQKNSATVADGISSETIRRTPDRTTGEVIRRVSGATIQDNKFAVIRGLSDRYNVALLNGGLLPSTEPDRRAFSFDLFPSNLLDNLLIVKTASADLPGEFAGGAILLNTKDIPEENYVHASLSGSYNTITTFKSHIASEKSGSDWLGFDDGTRALPSQFPDAKSFQSLTKTEKIEQSKLFANDWAVQNRTSAPLNTNVQLTTGMVSDSEKDVVFGSTISMTYQNSNRIQNASRFDYDLNQTLFDYDDTQFRNNILWGAMVNSAMKIKNRQKLTLQANYTTNTDNLTNERMGSDFEQERFVRATSFEYTENHLLTTRLGGEHAIGERNYKVNWGLGYNRSSRDIPSLRRMFYTKNFDSEEEQPFRAFVPFGSADPYRSGRFYSNLVEDGLNGNVDFTIPFTVKNYKQSFKMGGLYQRKDRDFAARVMGFVRSRIAGFDTQLLEKEQGEIFTAENISADGFVMDEITNASDAYSAGSDLGAAYAMLDNRIGEKVRLSWGVRMENFNQRLNSTDYTGQPVSIDRTTTNFLPSANLTFSLNTENQLRLSASQTVSRPEFRELAPFAFYDFYLNGNVVGNPELSNGTVSNFDLRYEWFPGKNQMFSTSLFYKNFNNPIEFTFNTAGAGTRTFNYQNIPTANVYGVEMEVRKNFEFIDSRLENLVFFANGALIRSKLDLQNVSAFDTTRAMQGQSPYIFNAGLSYNLPKWGLNTTLVYNVIGDRISQVGVRGLYADVYERHRHLLDFQISKQIGRKGELKLNISDLLRPDFMYYQDNNANHKFDEGVDNVMQRLNFGTSISLAFSYRI